ncbi:hypothetical protein DO237_21100, partial [Salmonella enterica]|nr:hypothetical protein [Salmonella enterica]
NKDYFLFITNKTTPLMRNLLFFIIITTENINIAYYWDYQAENDFYSCIARVLFLNSLLEEFSSLW